MSNLCCAPVTVHGLGPDSLVTDPPPFDSNPQAVPALASAFPSVSAAVTVVRWKRPAARAPPKSSKRPKQSRFTERSERGVGRKGSTGVPIQQDKDPMVTQQFF